MGDLESNATPIPSTAIADASCDGDKLPWALIPGGVSESGGALWLLIHNKPGGMFLHHGKVVVYTYYAILAAVFLFGFVEAAVGFWVAADLHDQRRQAYGRKVMWFSVFPLVLVAGLGGVGKLMGGSY